MTCINIYIDGDCQFDKEHTLNRSVGLNGVVNLLHTMSRNVHNAMFTTVAKRGMKMTLIFTIDISLANGTIDILSGRYCFQHCFSLEER